MNIHNFKKLVEIFEDLNDDIKGSHGSVLLQADGSRGGLIDLVVVAADYDDTEELHKIYKSIASGFTECDADIELSKYNRGWWIDTLEEFLDCSFPLWAHQNPEIWGNKKGHIMYSRDISFGKYNPFSMTNNDIIKHLRKVCNNLFKPSCS